MVQCPRFAAQTQFVSNEGSKLGIGANRAHNLQPRVSGVPRRKGGELFAWMRRGSKLPIYLKCMRVTVGRAAKSIARSTRLN